MPYFLLERLMNTDIKKSLLMAGLAGLFCGQIFAGTSFSVYDINSENQLLYSVERKNPGSPESSTLFAGHLGKTSAEGKAVPLTCVPEKIELLSDEIIQLRNTYGTARFSLSSGKFMWTSRGADFPEIWSECDRQCESPDGKWVCQEDSLGNLTLVQSATGIHVQVSAGASVSDRELVKWSADSRIFLYEESGFVYFASTDAAVRKLLPPASMRKIGAGTLDSVQWVGDVLYYVNGDILYKIEGKEMYTRGLYYPVVGSGKPLARLTYDFDPFHDRFWIDGSGKYLLYLNEKKVAVLYAVPENFGFLSVREMENMIGLNGSILSIEVFWTKNKYPLLWIENLSYSKGKKSASVYSMEKGLKLLESYEEPGSVRLSPDGKNVAFSYGTRLEIRKVDGWKSVAKVSGEKILSFKWRNPASVIAGGNKTLFNWEYSESKRDWVKNVLYLSSIKEAVWEGDKINAWTDMDNTCFEYDPVRGGWNAVGKKNPPALRGGALNGKFRVYVGDSPNSAFENAVFVHSLASPAFTYPLIPEAGEEKKLNGKVSIVFDATEGNEGLAQVLAALEKYNLRGTFFINGEFIRRYPMEVCQILASGNHCASGFFTTADLLSKDFNIDEDFIMRGLARNEDEFFAATGKELELFWHAPYYNSSWLMKKAGESAGYTYVDAWNKVNDRVSFEQALSDKGIRYMTADEVIDVTTENLYDGMVICVDVGNINGSRSDYVYEKIQRLISEILRAGYGIVPIK